MLIIIFNNKTECNVWCDICSENVQFLFLEAWQSKAWFIREIISTTNFKCALR